MSVARKRAMAADSPPATLWVKLEDGSVDLVKTIGCDVIDEFAEAIKTKFAPLLDHVCAAQISVFLKETDDVPLKRSYVLNLIPNNDAKHPLFVKVPSTVPTRVPSPIFTITDMVIYAHGIVYDAPHLERAELLSNFEFCLARSQFVVFSAPAGSGKTSMFELIRHKYPSLECSYICCRPGKSLAEFLLEAKVDLEKETCPEKSTKLHLVFVDDAQETYWDEHSWHQLLKHPWLNYHTHVRFIISASHTLRGDVDSPAELQYMKAVSGLTRNDFLLSEAEAEEFLNLPSGFGLPASWQQFSELKRIILQQCAGLVGALRKSVTVLYMVFDIPDSPEIAEEDLIRYYLLSTYVLDVVTRIYGYSHCCPVGNIKFKEYLAKFFSSKSLPVTLPDNLDENDRVCILNLQKSGLLTADSNEFSSSLAKRFFVNKLFSRPSFYPAASLFDLIRESIQSLSASQLALSTLYGHDLPEEAPFQMLLMIALAECTPPSCVICPELSKIFPDTSTSGGGEIDFFLNGDIRYGIELLVNGDGTKEHLDRFAPNGGKYSALNATDYAVVDFRTSKDGKPKRLKVQHDRRVTVFFKRGGNFKSCVCFFGNQETPVRLNLKP